MQIQNRELAEHYNFYLDNLDKNEIPLTFTNWVYNYYDELKTVLKG